MNYIFEPPPTPSVAIHNKEERFPVRRIFCVGRNYAAHAIEMGMNPKRDPPFFFTKPADAILDSGSTVPYPPETQNFHYEIELVVAIGREGFRVAIDDSVKLIYGYAVGIDLTRRDLQLAAREQGRPWDWGKAFDLSAPCAPIYSIAETGELVEGKIWLDVNGERRQESDIKKLIWNVGEVISILSHSMRLKPGDLVYTGTPEGVGKVGVGDRMTGGIDRLGTIEIAVGESE